MIQSRNMSLAQTKFMPIFKGCGCHKSVTEDVEVGLKSGGVWGLPTVT